MAKDILGKALFEYHQKRFKKPLLLHNNYGKPESQPLHVFFQNSRSMPELDMHALNLCRGKILDIGAGTGRHSLELQKKGLDVTSLDNSPCCVRLMKDRGLQHVVEGDIFNYEGETFDTLLLMMNGIGVCQTLDKLSPLLEKLKLLLNPNGQVIFDSSDISYLYIDDPFPNDRYFGEIGYRYEYHGEVGEWFKWLYVDIDTMDFMVAQAGFYFQVVYRNKKDQYLARMTIK